MRLEERLDPHDGLRESRLLLDEGTYPDVECPPAVAAALAGLDGSATLRETIARAGLPRRAENVLTDEALDALTDLLELGFVEVGDGSTRCLAPRCQAPLSELDPERGGRLGRGVRRVDRLVAEEPSERRAERERRAAAGSPAGTAAARCRSARCAITASRSGFGMPFRFVLPSAASANIVSISDSNCSAGRISQTKCAISSPAFQNLCGVPAGTVRRWPGPATSFLRPTLKPTRAAEHLEALLLARVDVRRGDEAVRLDVGLDHDGLAAGLARRLAEDDPLAGDRVLDAVSCADHGRLLFSGRLCGVSLETIRGAA